MVGDAGTIAAFPIAIGESFCDGATGIGDGAVVEITAHDHGVMLMLPDECGYGLCLGGTLHGGLTDFLIEHVGDGTCRVAAQVLLYQVLELQLVLA